MVTLENAIKSGFRTCMELKLEGNKQKLKKGLLPVELFKLQKINTIKGVIEYILNSDHRGDDATFKKEIDEYITKCKKQYNGEDAYQVSTPLGNIACGWSRDTGKIEIDERNEKQATDYFKHMTHEATKEPYWLLQLTLTRTRILG